MSRMKCRFSDGPDALRREERTGPVKGTTGEASAGPDAPGLGLRRAAEAGPEPPMDADRVFLQEVGAGIRPGGVRLFTWREPTVSVGKSQRPEPFLGRGVPVVVRPSGGGAVFHGADLCATVCVRSDDPRFGGDVLGSTRRIHEFLARALRAIGIPVEVSTARPPGVVRGYCFGETGWAELTLGGRKLVGGAQGRRRGALVHQASINAGLDRDFWSGLFPEHRSSLDRCAVVADAVPALGSAAALEAALAPVLARLLAGE